VLRVVVDRGKISPIIGELGNLRVGVINMPTILKDSY
jgi:hypothetical protein